MPVGLVGAGWVVQNGYVPHLKAGPYRVVSAYDPDPVALERLVAALPGEVRVAPSVDAVVEDSPVILVASPSPLHVSHCVTGLRAGRLVVCEKPVAITGAQVDGLQEAAQQGGGVLLGAAVCRHRRDVRQWLAWVARAGRVRELRLRWIRSKGVPAPGSWQTRDAGGWTGVLPDIGYHLLDLVVAALGPPRSIAVHSASGSSRGSASGAAWYGATSTASELARYTVVDRFAARFLADDVAVSIEVSWQDAEPGDVTELWALLDTGEVDLEGLFGYSTDRRLADQRCRFVRSSNDVVTVEYPTTPGLLHGEAFAGVLDDAAFAYRGGEPRVGWDALRATASLVETLQDAMVLQ